ncbi:unnamed protein product [Allacma fusca]|uniref:Uncharacterized protein n=1 Tax=Allacma fusca TaxID=39272 RepID=A0A8J2PGS9_9HEXA|nr:unnamed protein product [Allacma fusca]
MFDFGWSSNFILEKIQLEEQSVAMSESERGNEALESSRKSLGFGISADPSSKSNGSLEMKALREVVEQMRSDQIFTTLRSYCPDGQLCGLKLTNCSTFNLINGVTCVIVVANGLNTSIKLRGCRSCERSNLVEVPPLGVEMLFATATLSIEAAIARMVGTKPVELPAVSGIQLS